MPHSNCDQSSFSGANIHDCRLPETTGRYLIGYKNIGTKNSINSLKKLAGLHHVICASDSEDAEIDLDDSSSADGFYLPILGVAVVKADPSQLQPLMSRVADMRSDIEFIEEERFVHHLSHRLTSEYLRGYRDAVCDLTGRLIQEFTDDQAQELASEVYRDTREFTWGLQATQTHTSPFSGRGVKVAILDTGLDLNHKDFKGRSVIGKSFVPGQTVQDIQGHGTHCTGTACGPRKSSLSQPGYGCASEAEIYVGKVLDNSGRGTDGSILKGLEWAITKECQVISMSLGSNSDKPSVAYETVGKLALDRNCLVIAAAGNNADRAIGDYGFVGIPANSLSIMAVGAIDNQLRVANFSARSSTKTGVAGKVDIVAPGVNVFSSAPGGRFSTLSGTSMATPHVAGIAALWIEATNKQGQELWTTLIQNSRQIPGDIRDIGCGLVQVPQ